MNMAEAKEGRRQRVPFSAQRKRLQVDAKFPGFHIRWFNDQDDRLQRAEDAGYEYVHRKEVGQVGDKDVSNGNTDVNSRVSRVVGRTKDNQPIRAFLMKIRDEWYRDDKSKKEEVNRRVDEAIRAGKAGGADVQNSYGGVKLETT
jgi:hypothetical protein